MDDLDPVVATAEKQALLNGGSWDECEGWSALLVNEPGCLAGGQAKEAQKDVLRYGIGDVTSDS